MSREDRLTLRDARRIVARGRHPSGYPRYRDLAEGCVAAQLDYAGPDAPRALRVEIYAATRRSALLSGADLDRLIGEHGPSADLLRSLWPVSPEESQDPREEHHADLLDEEADRIDEDAATHGGSGCSGDIDHRAETAREEGATMQEEALSPSSDPGPGEDGDQPATGAGEEDPVGDDRGTDPGEGAETDAEPLRGEASAGSSEPGSDEGDPASADDPSADAPGVAWAEDGAPRADTPAFPMPEPGHDGSGASPSEEAHRAWGGIHARLDEAMRDPRSPDAELDAREVRRALERLLPPAMATHGDPSPRISGRRLVREIVSRRMRLSAARREELARPVALLLCDCSGSCAAVAVETLAACVQIAQSRDDVLLVQHSNGIPTAAMRGGREIPVPPWRGGPDRPCLDWYAEQIGKAEVAGAVAFGDSDADWLYSWIVEDQGAPLWWLDSYRCRIEGQPRPARAPSVAADSNMLRYYLGVRGARGAAYALRDSLRRK